MDDTAAVNSRVARLYFTLKYLQRFHANENVINFKPQKHKTELNFSNIFLCEKNSKHVNLIDSELRLGLSNPETDDDKLEKFDNI